MKVGLKSLFSMVHRLDQYFHQVQCSQYFKIKKQNREEMNKETKNFYSEMNVILRTCQK